MIGAVLERVFREEHGRVLGAAMRVLRDLDAAEEAVHDAYSRALERWPVDGLPDKPGAWLVRVATRRALDVARASGRATKRETPLDDEAMVAPEPPSPDGLPPEPDVEDDRLRLMFVACHPALADRARAALALRTLGGLSTREIARAFLEEEATTAQRLVRAKAKISEAGIPFEVPSREMLPERVDDVLSVLYLVFNEGYASTEKNTLVRVDLCEEAIRLARLTVELLPEHPDARALLALLLLVHARSPARIDAEGMPVLLEEQDRSRWTGTLLDEGRRELDAAIASGARGPFVIQAAIASLHGSATSPESTDWPQIAGLYGALLRHKPDPVVELNAAVALFFAGERDKGRAWLEELWHRDSLSGYPPLAIARAELARRSGDAQLARAMYERAIALTRSPVERRYLERRVASLA